MDNEAIYYTLNKFFLGTVAGGVGGLILVGLASRFNFPHELPDDKIKKVIDDLLDPVATLGQMKKLYPSSNGQYLQEGGKVPVSSHVEYIEMKIIRRCNLDLNHLPLSRLEKIVAKVGKSVAKPCQSMDKAGTEPYSTLEEIKQKGLEFGAGAFSFQDSKMIHGDYVFNVLYHKTN